MYMLLFNVLQVLLSSFITFAEHDALGTAFVFIFPRNKNRQDVESFIAVDLINHSFENTTAEIYFNRIHYAENELVYQRENVTLTITATNYTRYKFDKNIVFELLEDGFNRYPDLRIFIRSPMPISVHAYNFIENGPGDAITVLPEKTAGKRYAVTLPSPRDDGSALFYLLPTIRDANIHLTILSENFTKSYYLDLKLERGKNVVMYSAKVGFTVHVVGDAAFHLITAVQNLRVSPTSTAKDFGWTMHTPIPLHERYSTHSDKYIIHLPTSNAFIITLMPRTKLTHLQVTGIKDNAEISITASMKNSLTIFNSSRYGIEVEIVPNSSVAHIFCYGGYGLYSDGFESGAFLDSLPSLSQFVSGVTSFVVPFDANTVTVIGDERTKITAYFDFSTMCCFVPVKYHDMDVYYATGTVAVGFHTFMAGGKYIILVSGELNGTAYGYTPALNVGHNF